MTGNKLKLIACVAMLIDHIAWAFFPIGGVGDFMHLVGRTTAPIMCYMIAEGFYHTRNINKYGARLWVFAMISQVPFALFERLPINDCMHGNVMFGLLFGLLALWFWKAKAPIENCFCVVLWRVILIIGVCMLAYFFTDWGAFAVLWVLFFGVFHGQLKKQMIAFSLVALCAASYYGQWFQLGLFLAVPLLLLYNGERGSRNVVSKWGFYIFYPAHLLILGLLR